MTHMLEIVATTDFFFGYCKPCGEMFFDKPQGCDSEVIAAQYRAHMRAVSRRAERPTAPRLAHTR